MKWKRETDRANRKKKGKKKGEAAECIGGNF